MHQTQVGTIYQARSERRHTQSYWSESRCGDAEYMDAVNNLANVFNRLIKHCLPRKLYIIVLQYCIVKVLCYSFTFVSTMVCLIAKTAKQAEPVFTLLTNCNQPVANGPVSAARPTDSVSAAY